MIFLGVFAAILVTSEAFFFDCSTMRSVHGERASGVYTINLPSGSFQAYCEMGINGGGYTFLSNKDIQRLTPADMKILFMTTTDVLIRLSNTDGTQPYTLIRPLNSDYLSVQLNSYVNYTQPKNYNLGPYLFVGVSPAALLTNNNIQGIYSNNKKISFKNTDRNPNSYFAFFTNPSEKPISNYHADRLIYEKMGVAVDWRRSALRMPSARRMPLEYFLFTEIHFGGHGAYSSSDRWLKSGTVASAIGFR